MTGFQDGKMQREMIPSLKLGNEVKDDHENLDFQRKTVGVKIGSLSNHDDDGNKNPKNWHI